MQKKDLKQLLKGMGDMHPVIVGLAGAMLLCLPFVLPADKASENTAFILGMACVLYAGGCGVASKIGERQAHKAESDKAMAELNARRAEIKRMMHSKTNIR